MAPKKKPDPSAHPSTSKAPPSAASNTAGGVEAHEGADAAGDVVGAGGTDSTSPAADAGAGNTGGEQRQQHPDGHAPQGTGEGVNPSVPLSPTDGQSHSNGTRTGANSTPSGRPYHGCTSAGTGDQAVALD
nr:merozoite surface antigen 2, allelic form 2-like [Aegilops tauschii subsp. strangulata]